MADIKKTVIYCSACGKQLRFIEVTVEDEYNIKTGKKKRSYYFRCPQKKENEYMGYGAVSMDDHIWASVDDDGNIETGN